MDPLSVGVLAPRVGKKAKRISEEVKDAPAELSEIRHEIVSLLSLVERLDTLVKEGIRADAEDQTLHTSDIELALRSCTNVMNQLSHSLDTVEKRLTHGVISKMKSSRSILSEREKWKELRMRLVHCN